MSDEDDKKVIALVEEGGVLWPAYRDALAQLESAQQTISESFLAQASDGLEYASVDHLPDDNVARQARECLFKDMGIPRDTIVFGPVPHVKSYGSPPPPFIVKLDDVDPPRDVEKTSAWTDAERAEIEAQRVHDHEDAYIKDSDGRRLRVSFEGIPVDVGSIKQGDK